jgi:hypothetical protein
MPFVSLAVVMVALFVVCRWAGHTLSHHYQDGWEVAAVAAMGLGAFAALWAAQVIAAGGGALPTIGLVGAGGGGLFAGYLRGERI